MKRLWPVVLLMVGDEILSWLALLLLAVIAIAIFIEASEEERRDRYVS